MNKEPKQLTNRRYQKLKTELAICQIGGLFLALYQDENVPDLIITNLQKDLPNYFQFSVPMTEKKVWFPIFFEQTFEQVGKQSNIYHVLGIELLPEQSKKDFLQYLQYGRERFKALPYSIVFWMHPPFAKELLRVAPDFHHWVFGTYDFTDITSVVIERNKGEILAFHKDVMAVFLNKINHYLEKLIWQYEHWQEVKDSGKEFLLKVMSRVDLHTYYVNLYGTDKNRTVLLLDDVLDVFLADEQQSFTTLLGDFGTGKSSFSLHYFIMQAQHYLLDNSRRIPIFVSLKDYPSKLNLETFITKEFYEKFGQPFSLATFQALALQGQFLFFIDGFDEMGSMSNEQEAIENFKELTKLSFENIQFVTQSEDRKPTNKVFMTCRHFCTEAQEREILKEDKTVLYRNNYATKSNYQVTRIYLVEFNQAQIKEGVLKSVGDKGTAKQIMNIIKDTYNLAELSTRPLLLDMIINTLPKLKDKKQINVADLYKAYTDMWIEWDGLRSQMIPLIKREFMWEVAVSMYKNKKGGDLSLCYSDLEKLKEEFFKQDTENNAQDYYKYETTTSSFLMRNQEGNYQFVHKSFMEYFLAECSFARLKTHQDSLFQYSSVNDEVKFFIKFIISTNKEGLDLSGLDLPGFILNNVDLTGINLEKANLEGANLERAKLKGAKLKLTRFKGAMLQRAILQEVDIVGKSLKDINFHGANFQGANLQGVIFEGVILEQVNFDNANLEGASLERAKLKKASFKGANLKQANLTMADLQEANFTMAYLQGAVLQEAELVGAIFFKTTLKGANLQWANFEGVTFKESNLEGADFQKANLQRATFEETNIEQINLKGAKLGGAIGLPKTEQEVGILFKLWLKAINGIRWIIGLGD